MATVKDEFKNIVEISDQPDFINGQSWDDVYTLNRSMEKKIQQLVQKLPPIPNICEQTRIYVQRWAVQQGTPIISIDKFIDLFQDTCKKALGNPLISKDYKRFLTKFIVKDDGWELVVSYLKDSGEVIYFQQSNLMVVDLQWLGMGVFGQLVGMFGEPHHGRDRLQLQNGFISKKGFRQLLGISLDKVGLSMTSVSEEQFIKLMIELHLCYESKVEGHQVCYFIPICAYGEKDLLRVDQQLTWPLHEDNQDYIFLGLRLQCSDLDCTLLTPGFFPRLQVLFHNYGSKHGLINCRIELQPNAILICAEFLDIFKFDAEVGCHIDILARSTEGYLRSSSFLHEHIISHIRSFCVSYEGCPGVTLVEGILRCKTVECLTPCRYREHQCIMVDELFQKVLGEERKGYKYYIHSWESIFDNMQDQPCILKANKEYATVINSHVILGRKEYLDRAKAEFQEWKSNSSLSGDTPTQLSPQVKAAVQQVPHIAGRYPNHSVERGQRRGLAIIVSMEEDRPGGAVDRGRPEALLKILKFDTEIVVDDSEQIKTRLKQVVKLPDLATDDCFLCCINAHGGTEEDGRQYIHMSGTDHEKLYVVDDILKPITECTYLAKKPKVFVINACRGTGSLVASKKAEGSDVGGSQVVGKTAGQVRPLHSVSDCLVVFSTSHGEQSFRDPQEGTNFIIALMDAIVEAQTADVLSILTSVIGKVTEMEVWDGPEKKFQCPELYSTLTKGLYWS